MSSISRWEYPTPSEVMAWWADQTGEEVGSPKDQGEKRLRSGLFLIMEILEESDTDLGDWEIVMNRDPKWIERNPEATLVIGKAGNYRYWLMPREELG